MIDLVWCCTSVIRCILDSCYSNSLSLSTAHWEQSCHHGIWSGLQFGKFFVEYFKDTCFSVQGKLLQTQIDMCWSFCDARFDWGREILGQNLSQVNINVLSDYIRAQTASLFNITMWNLLLSKWKKAAEW